MESNSWHKMSSIVYEARKLEVDGKPGTHVCMHARTDK